MPKLQLALDFLDLEEAIEIAKETSSFVDIMEAGTPLIKYNGMEAVRRLKREFPDKIINADLKTADVGDMETEMAADAGANIVSILGVAPIETIKSAVEESKKHNNVKIAVDTIGVKNLEERIKEIEQTGADYLLIHCGIDEQKTGKDPFNDIRLASRTTKMPLIVAGGINAESAKNFREMKGVEIIIVGGAITRAEEPKKAAKEIKEILNNYGQAND